MTDAIDWDALRAVALNIGIELLTALVMITTWAIAVWAGRN